MKRILIWLWLLTKRLYKKPTFLVLLALIPALVLGYSTVARQDSGIVTIALAAYDNNDPMANAIMDDLMQSKLLYFRRCDTPEEANSLLNTGKADAAWIFAEDLEAKLCKFITATFKQSVVEIIERQSTIPMKLTREKLSGTVFAHLSPNIYLNYIRTKIPQLKNITNEQLLEYYENVKVEGRLFEFFTLDGEPAGDMLESDSYLTSPIRGMLAVVVTLCGLAGAMYAKQDEKRGTFSWMPERKRPLTELAGLLVCVVNASVAVVIALVFMGVTVGFIRELLALVLFVVAVCAFCMLISRLCGSLQMLGMWTPVLLVVMLIVCPVFFDLGNLFWLQLMFPVTYYVNGIYTNQYLLLTLIYTMVCFALCAGIDKLRLSHFLKKAH